MKAYTYFDSDLIHALPMSLGQIERARVKLPETFNMTDNPKEADIFWLPVDLGHIEAYHGGAGAVATAMKHLPYWKGNERRHVAYFCSDGPEPTGLPCIMFRQSFHQSRKDANCVAWPYAVEDFCDLVTNNFDALEYDVSFVGSKASSRSRIESFDSVVNTLDLVWFMDDSRMHWGSIEHTEIGKQRKRMFVDSMRKSAMVLAARGGGMSCYRFFEAISAGRVPVLLADDWELPHADLIDWDNIIVRIPECRAKDTGKILLEFLRRISNEELCEMGKAARAAWQEYLAPARWAAMMERCVRAKLAG